MACLLPGLTPADLHIQRNTQGCGTAHLLDQHAFGGFTLTGGDFEDDFVVHLQQHAGLQALFAQAAVNVDHSDLDDVRGGALNRGVEGGAFGGFTAYTVGRVQVGQHAAAAENGFGVAVLVCLLEHAAQESSHASEAFEVVGAQFACFVRADVQLLGEAEAGQTVCQTVGHCLDLGALLGGDFFGATPKTSEPT